MILQDKKAISFNPEKVEYRRCEEKYNKNSELQYKMTGRCFIKTGIEESKLVEPRCTFRNKYNSPEIDCAFGFGFAAVGQSFDETAIVGQEMASDLRALVVF